MNNISVSNAKRDKEWIVLPLNRFDGEFSSKLDKGIVYKEQNFKYK
jgi:hypothetical protein